MGFTLCRTRGPIKQWMRGVCSEERCTFDSIGVGVAGTPHSWPYRSTDARGELVGALHNFDSIVLGVTGMPRAWPF